MINFLINSCRSAGLVFHTCGNRKSLPSTSAKECHLKRQLRFLSYPPMIKPSLFPLLPLEKHSCQKRQHSGWKWAPQHLMEHGKEVLLSLQKTWQGKAENSPQTPGCEGLLATGSIWSFAQDWAALQLREAEVWPALAKQPTSKPCWQVFQILVKDKGSKAAPNREALGRRKHRSMIKPQPQNPQCRFSFRVTE